MNSGGFTLYTGVYDSSTNSLRLALNLPGVCQVLADSEEELCTEMTKALTEIALELLEAARQLATGTAPIAYEE